MIITAAVRGTRMSLSVTLITLLLSFGAVTAQASPVTIQFGFTSFTSTVESPNSLPVHTFVTTSLGTTEVFPVIDTPFALPFIPSVDSIDFYEETFSGPQTHNRVAFVPGPTANVALGQDFLLGTFNLVNGTWFGSADMAFSMVTVSSDPAFDGHAFSDTLHLQLNPFNPNPDVSADYFYFLSPGGASCAAPGSSTLISCQSLRVYELFDSPILPHVDGQSNAGSVELWGHIDSLIPTEFRNPQGGLFISGSLVADPNPILQRPPAAPEPTTLVLVGTGLVMAARRVRRRARVS